MRTKCPHPESLPAGAILTHDHATGTFSVERPTKPALTFAQRVQSGIDRIEAREREQKVRRSLVNAPNELRRAGLPIPDRMTLPDWDTLALAVGFTQADIAQKRLTADQIIDAAFRFVDCRTAAEMSAPKRVRKSEASRSIPMWSTPMSLKDIARRLSVQRP